MPRWASGDAYRDYYKPPKQENSMSRLRPVLNLPVDFFCLDDSGGSGVPGGTRSSRFGIEPGVTPGYFLPPLRGLLPSHVANPRLTPWAAYFRRFAAVSECIFHFFQAQSSYDTDSSGTLFQLVQPDPALEAPGYCQTPLWAKLSEISFHYCVL